jgi:hypothetical protein
MSRVPPTMSKSEKNALGQKVFGSKVPETPVVESPAASAADVMSAAAVGAGVTAASEADKVETSAPPATGGEGGDHSTSNPQEVPPPRGIIDEGMEVVNDEDQCLYADTPWEAEVVTDRQDLKTFKNATCTIGAVLLVRTFVEFLRFLLRVLECHEV